MWNRLCTTFTKFRFGPFCFLTIILTSQNVEETFALETIDLIHQPGVYKFIVAIKSDHKICTGSIVNKDWVLTAAHCVYHNDDLLAGKDVEVIAGITNYEYPQEEFAQHRTGDEIKVHPRFWIGRLAKFDIALVRVNESFQFNDQVGNISVAGDRFPIYNEAENNCMSLGFGGTLGAEQSRVKSLKAWNVTAAYGGSNCPCTRRFQWRRLLCAKNADYAKLCQGDDGGPLVCGTTVRGIAHMVRNWYVCREDSVYPLPKCRGSPERGLSIYMYLCPFNDWMHGVVDDIPPKPADCKAPSTVFCTALAVLLVFVHFARAM